MDIVCPRCGTPADVDYYGPCDTCRDGLRAEMTGSGGQVPTAAEYEPKMNVTPNAVALKDD
jgi:hypothetical protein